MGLVVIGKFYHEVLNATLVMVAIIIHGMLNVHDDASGCRIRNGKCIN